MQLRGKFTLPQFNTTHLHVAARLPKTTAFPVGRNNTAIKFSLAFSRAMETIQYSNLQTYKIQHIALNKTPVDEWTAQK